jgi:hypothetical protein
LPRQKDKANEFKQWVQTTYPQYRLMSGDNSYAIIATSVIPSKRIILEYQK